MSDDIGKLVQITAKFTTSGRCQQCNKRVKRAKTFTARTLNDLVDQAAMYNRRKQFYCKTHKPAVAEPEHIINFERANDEELVVWLDGQELASANHDDHGWAGMEALEQAMRTTATRLGWKVLES